MKKSVLFAALLIAFFAIFSSVSAASSDVNSTAGDRGFSCLANKTADCSSLSTQEQIFTSLATGRCISNLTAKEKSNGCFPGLSGSCSITSTAQAILSLKNSGESTNDSAKWLLSQNQTTSDIQWYFQIDSNGASTCSITYSGNAHPFAVSADKKLSGTPGSCISFSSNGYWLSVSPSCYGTQFTIQCDNPFAVSKLYQRIPTTNYPTVYILPQKQSASAGGAITDSVGSYCFAPSGSGCSYESTLWASLALDNLKYNVSSYIPYLTMHLMDSSNNQYLTLSYSILHILTGNNLQDLLGQQKTVIGSGENQYYWDSSAGKYYGTALALLSLQNDDVSEKTDAINWLLGVQGPDGCWNSDNKLDTAFILYSIWGSKAVSSSGGGTTSTLDCASSGGYCLSYNNCVQAGGEDLGSQYACSSSSYVCCSEKLALQTCSSQFGQICNANETCTGTPVDASDTSSSETCCVSGACTPTQQQTTSTACELAGGACRSSCLSTEVSSSESCGVSGTQTCCMISQQNSNVPKSNLWLIILLAALIVLATLGIIFRKKLLPLWMKIKSMFKKGNGSAGAGRGTPRGPRPPFSPGSSPRAMRNSSMQPRPQHPKSASEVNDVLKKLKEMSK